MSQHQKVKEENKKSETSSKLTDLINFKVTDMKTIEDYDRQFVRIANSLMNDHLLTVNSDYKYRISEIEFYYNDLEGMGKDSVHPDTFTHGDEMQRESG